MVRVRVGVWVRVRAKVRVMVWVMVCAERVRHRFAENTQWVVNSRVVS